MKKILFTALLLWGGANTFSQSQLSNWKGNSTELNFLTPYATATGTPSQSPTGYNCMYDNQGNLEFYISGGTLYDNSINNNPIAYLVAGGDASEYGIIPHPDNLTNLCTKKYFLITNNPGPTGMNPPPGSNYVFGRINTWLLDLNAPGGPSCVHLGLLGTTGGPVLPMAISRMDSNGNRFVYLPGGGKIFIYKVKANGFSIAGNSAGYNYNVGMLANEMELSNNGDKLAFATGNNKISVVDLAGGLPTNNPPYEFAPPTGLGPWGTGINGLEFDKSGNNLLYSSLAGNGASAGVYVKQLTAPASNPSAFVQGSAPYTGMLEKSYNGKYIICGSSNWLVALNGSSFQMTSWTAHVSGKYMPDQIDGEDYSGNLLSVTGSMLSCGPGSGTLTVHIAPTITGLNGYTVQVKNMTTNVVNTYTPQINMSIPVSLNSSTQFQVTLSNGACSVTKLWTITVSDCFRMRVTPIVHPVVGGKIMLTGEAEDPAFEQAHDIQSVWTVAELSPETNEAVYSIESPSCWQTPSGQPTTFMGFDTDQDYASDATLFNCQPDIPEGIFDPEKRYLITRTSSSAEFGTTIDAVCIDKGAVWDGQQEKSMHLSLEGTAEPTFVLYPNPSSGVINITTDGATPEKIELYDMAGVKVLERFDIAESNSVDLSSFTGGVYTIKIFSGDKTEVYKILLE